MGEGADYLKEKLKNLNQKQAICGGCILFLVLFGFGYFGIFRPVIVMDTDQAGIHVKNKGGMDALIYKVDGFWYSADQVALLANMPAIHQRVGPGAATVRLQIPDIPTPDEQSTQRSVLYMKLALRYKIPGIPIFRYTTPLYFEYDTNSKLWTTTKSIPPKYRALGKIAIGDIGEIQLSFH